MKHSRKGALAEARIYASIVLAAAGLFITQAPVASAHVTIVSTTPAQGAVVTSSPSQVSMLFSEPPTNPHLTVTGPGGKTYSTGHTQVSNAAVNTAISDGPSGVYTIAWAITAPDGDAQNGTWTYFYQAPMQPKS